MGPSANICLTDRQSYNESPITVRMQCGFDSQLFLVNSIYEAAAVFNGISSSCQMVKKLVLLGHGSPGRLNGAGWNLKNIDALTRFSYIFAPNAQIQLRSCSIARGCPGDLFLVKLASSLLAAGGSVIGPTHIFWTDPTGFIGLSLNGEYRMLTYRPSEKKKEIWETIGLFSFRNESGPSHCSSEIRAQANLALRNSKLAPAHECLKVELNSKYYSALELIDEAKVVAKKLREISSFANLLSSQDVFQVDQVSRLLKRLNTAYDHCTTSKAQSILEPYLQYDSPIQL